MNWESKAQHCLVLTIRFYSLLLIFTTASYFVQVTSVNNNRCSDQNYLIIHIGRKNRFLKPLYTSHDFPEPKNAPATFHPPPKRLDQLRYEYEKLRISSSESDDTQGRPVPRRRASIGEVPDKDSNKARRQRKQLDPYSPASATMLKEAKASRERRLRRAASLNEKEAVHQQRIKWVIQGV